MTENPQGPRQVYLMPSEVLVCAVPVEVKTVLGSCVAITMRSPRLGLAAVSHCVLPAVEDAPGAHIEVGRYVDYCIRWMVDWLAVRGAPPDQLEVKLFGGAELSAGPRLETGCRVGKRNIETARAILGAAGIVPAASDVGGERGRLLVYYTDTGEVRLKRLPAREVEATWNQSAFS